MAVTSRGLWRVNWLPGVGHLRHESVDMVDGVGCGLDPAVGQRNHKATRDEAVGILCFCLLEVGLAVVISHSVLVGVRLGGELLWGIRSRGSISGRSSSESCGDESGGDEDLKIDQFCKTVRLRAGPWHLP